MTRRHLFTIIGVVAASSSAGALVMHALGLMPMYLFVDAVAAPALVVLLLAGVLAKRINEHVFVHRLLAGLWMGLAATLCYDAIRYILHVAGVFPFDVFFSHRLFGKLLTGYPPDDQVSILVGWAYHFWNGLSLGIMYTLVAGPAPWFYAVAWSLFLEIAWLTALPTALDFKLTTDVVVLSLIGHTVYGVVLGVLAQRRIQE